MPDTTATEPRSASQRRTPDAAAAAASPDQVASGGLPDAPEAGAPGTDAGLDPGDATMSAAAAAASTGATAAPAPAARLHHVVSSDGEEETISPDELAAIRAYRASRAAQIRDEIATAPVAIGTDLNPYTLVHLRGCPKPDRTETYEVKDPADRLWTVHRCVECGAHLAVQH